MSNALCYGIDLGTTNSCISIYFKGSNQMKNPMVIENRESEYTTPSVVSFDEKCVFVGKLAAQRKADYPKSTIYHIKRLIGRKFSDPHVINDKKNYPYKLKKNEKDLPLVLIKNEKADDYELQPEQISALVLSYLKECADEKCLEKTNKVVITVPANFNDYQRRATMDAAKIANLDPVCVISEPTAACIAHAFYKGYRRNASNVLVYDFGGGTLDVSLVKIEGGDITVLATAGDSHCGGADIDQEIFKMAVNKMVEQGLPDITQIDPDLALMDKRKRIKSKLLIQCEEAKKNLSSAETSDIMLTGIETDSDEFVMKLKRSDIESIIRKMENKLIKPIETVLKKNSGVTDLILVGGSSRIPCVKNLVESKLKLSASAPDNPDEVIALGGSIYGAYKLGAKIKDFPHFNIVDVTPMAISFGVKGGKLQEAIPRNTPKPCMSDRMAFQPSSPDVKVVQLTLYEGDSKVQKEAFRVGTFEIKLPEKEDDDEKIRIFQRVEVNDNEITLFATVTKNDEKTEAGSEEKKLTIKNDKPANSEEDITRMKNENMAMTAPEDDKDEDEDFAKLALGNLNIIKASRNQLSKDAKVRKAIDSIVKELKGRIDKDEKMSYEQFSELMTELESKIAEVVPDYKRPEKFNFPPKK